MFSHVMVGADDMDRAKLFYDALFQAIGGKASLTDDMGRLIYLHNGAVFMVSKPLDGQPASCANGGTIGFTMASPEQTDAWHAAGIETGGTSCEDPPGFREASFGRLYVAYLRDPSGNKLCALHRFG